MKGAEFFLAIGKFRMHLNDVYSRVTFKAQLKVGW